MKTVRKRIRNHERDLDILRDGKKKDCEWLRKQKRMRKSVILQYKGRGRLRWWIVEKVKDKDWERLMNHEIMSEKDWENARKEWASRTIVIRKSEKLE